MSGPGALSRRTDGGPGDKQAISRLPNAKYGESSDFESIQAGAPVGSASGPGATPPMDASSMTGFDAPSARPDEPVTAGADAGAGPGSEILGIPSEEAGDLQSIAKHLPMLEWFANQPNASPSTKAFVRRIKAEL